MIKIIFILLGLIPLAWSTQVNANYFTTKLALLSLSGGLCFLFAAFHQINFLRIPSGKWKWLALFFIFLQLLYGLLFDFPSGLYYLPKFFSLLGIILFLLCIQFDLSLFLKKHEWMGLGFFGILFIFTSRDFVSQIGSGIPFQSGALIHPLGNVNMLAEFYLLCVPLVFYWITQKYSIHQYVKIFIFILLNLVIVATKSRSAYLGLGLWWVFMLYHFIFHKIKLILLVLLVVLSGLAFHYRFDFSETFGKSVSTQERLNFYRSAWDLIRDRPFGVAFQYSNQIVPYRLAYPMGPQETEYPDQPHSEILKWGVEFGWLGAIVALISLVFIVKKLIYGKSFLLQGAGLVIFPQLLFQFPFENPASLVMLALYLYLLSQILPQEVLSWTKPFKGLCFLFSLGLIYYAVIFFISVYQESHFPNDLEKTAQACRINPSYLRGCIRKNYNLLNARHSNALKKSLKEDMKFNYYASDYLKILSESVSEGNFEPDLVVQDESLTSVSVYDSVAHQAQIFKKNCQIQQVYVFIYKDQEHFSDEDRRSCQSIPAPFQFSAKPREFDRDYKTWLETILK